MRAAFDIGGTKIEFARVADDGTVTRRRTLPTPHTSWQDFVDAIRSLIEADGGADQIGMSIAGTTDAETGVALAANVPAINGHRVEAELADELGIRVRLGNDADCFALAEALVGAGRGMPIVFGVILGSGAGGGIVVNGRLVRGAHGVTGEWGHGPVLADTVRHHGIPLTACGCGQVGCVDTYASARGIERIHLGLTGIAAESRDITAAWHQGEPAASRTIELYVSMLTGPLAMIVNTLGPWIIPVGGGLSNDARLIAEIDRAVRTRVLGDYRGPLVVPGLTRGASGLIGAAMLADEIGP